MVLVETAIIIGFLLLTGYAVLSIGGGSSRSRTGSGTRSRDNSRGGSSESSSTSSSSGRSTSVPDSPEGRRRFLSSLRDRSPNVREGISGAFGNLKQRFSGEEKEVQELEGKMKALIENDATLKEAIEVLKNDHPELESDLNKLKKMLEEDETLQKDLIKHIEDVLEKEEKELQELMKVETLREKIEKDLLSEYDELSSEQKEVDEVRDRTEQIGEMASNIWGAIESGEANPEEAAEELEEMEENAEGLRSKLPPIRNRLQKLAEPLGSLLSKLRNIRDRENDIESKEGETDKEIDEEKKELKEEESRFKRALNIFQGSIADILNRKQKEEFDRGFDFEGWLEDGEEEVVDEEIETEEELEAVTDELESATEDDEDALEAIREQIKNQEELTNATEKEILWQEIRILMAEEFVLGEFLFVGGEDGHLNDLYWSGSITKKEKEFLLNKISHVMKMERFSEIPEEERPVEHVDEIVSMLEFKIDFEELKESSYRAGDIKENLEELRSKIEDLKELVNSETERPVYGQYSEDYVGFKSDHQ